MQRVLSLLLSVIYTIITMHYHHNDHSVINGLLLLSTARRYCLIPTAAATVDKAALPGCCRRYVLYLGFIFWSVSGLFCRLFRISLYSYSFYFFVSSQKTHKYHTKWCTYRHTNVCLSCPFLCFEVFWFRVFCVLCFTSQTKLKWCIYTSLHKELR